MCECKSVRMQFKHDVLDPLVLLFGDIHCRRYRIATYRREIEARITERLPIEDVVNALKAETTPEEFWEEIVCLFWTARFSGRWEHIETMLSALPPGERRNSLLANICDSYLDGVNYGRAFNELAHRCVPMMTEPLRSHYLELFSHRTNSQQQSQQQQSQQQSRQQYGYTHDSFYDHGYWFWWDD
jgi:hypothetical protein